MSESPRFIKLILRFVIGAVFVYSSIGKLLHPQDFAEVIVNYKVFGSYFSQWGAVLVPMLELLLGLMLISGFWLREAFLFTAVLYIAFDILIIQALLRGLDISCGCFTSAASGPIDFIKILENLGLTSLVLLGLFLHLKPKSEPES